MEQIKEDLSDAGFSQAEIEALYGAGATVITPDMDAGDSPDLTTTVPDWMTPELAEQGNKNLYKGSN